MCSTAVGDSFPHDRSESAVLNCFVLYAYVSEADGVPRSEVALLEPRASFFLMSVDLAAIQRFNAAFWHGMALSLTVRIGCPMTLDLDCPGIKVSFVFTSMFSTLILCSLLHSPELVHCWGQELKGYSSSVVRRHANFCPTFL